MSAWERARYIPWDRVPQDGSNLEAQKERIFRELHQETIMQDEPSAATHLAANVDDPSLTDGATTTTTSSSANNWPTSLLLFQTKVPYSHLDLIKHGGVGLCIGSITGAVFGFMESMRTVGESPILTRASNQAKGNYILQGSSRSATVFGLSFGAFYALKYGVRVTVNPGDTGEIVIAGLVSTSALVSRPAYRASAPYLGMLIFMDAVNIMMRNYK